MNLTIWELRGNQQRKAGGRDERHGPDQIQIYPGFSQNAETQLLINDERDQPGDEKISERVNKQASDAVQREAKPSAWRW